MPETSGYLRHPSLRGDTIAFVTEDDLWSVPAAGGIARRLTANLSEVSHPALSPDGQHVAFTSREEHHPEVYCMPSSGGPAARVTFLGASATVRGWTPDGRILFTSEAGQPFAHLIHAYAVAPDGGATGAAQPATCGSPPRAPASSTGSCACPATPPHRCGSTAGSGFSRTTKGSATSIPRSPTAPISGATPTTTSTTPGSPRPTAPGSSTSTRPR